MFDHVMFDSQAYGMHAEPMSVDELQAYVDEMKAEISRTEAEIAKKKAYANAASSFFKT